MRTFGPEACGGDPDAAAFFERVRRVFIRAEESSGAVDRWYRIAGCAVRLRFAGPALAPLIAPAFEHLSAAPAPAPALTVCLWDVESGLPHVPAPPWRVPADEATAGARANGDEGVRAAFDVGTTVLSAFDGRAGLALYCARDARSLPGYELGAPLRSILQWAMRARGGLLVHAAAVGRPGGGVLIVGRGGVGKSTAALACLGTGLLYASDDYCLLSTDPAPYVHSVYNSAKLHPADLPHFPGLGELPSRSDGHDIDKTLWFLHPHRRAWLTRGFPLRAIVVPQVTDRVETAASLISAGAALRALAPSTLFQLAAPDASALAALAACVRRVPCYALRLGSARATIPRAIAAILSEVTAHP